MAVSREVNPTISSGSDGVRSSKPASVVNSQSAGSVRDWNLFLEQPGLVFLVLVRGDLPQEGIVRGNCLSQLFRSVNKSTHQAHSPCSARYHETSRGPDFILLKHAIDALLFTHVVSYQLLTDVP